MAIKSGFFDAESFDAQTIEGQTILVPDRAYSPSDMNDYLKSLVTDNGIILQYARTFSIEKKTDDYITPEEAAEHPNCFKLVVHSGAGRIRGHYVTNDGDIAIFVPHGSVDGGRWDNIILRLNYSARDIELKLLVGTAGAPSTDVLHIHGDVFPATSQEDNPNRYYDLVLANISIPAGATDVANIQVRSLAGNKIYCPYITHVIYTEGGQNAALQAIDDLLDQYSANFAAWFATLTENIEVSTTINQKKAFYNSGNGWDLNDIDGYTYSCDDDNNPRDVINVFYNGLKLREEEYTISSAGILRLNNVNTVTNGNDVYVQILVSQIGIPSYVNGDLILY